MVKKERNCIFLSYASELPESVRTLLRAKLLLTLKYNQPISRLGLVNWGFKKSTVSRVLRETNRDGLTLERYRLYRITERGYEIVNLLLKDSRLLEWINRTSINTKWIESYTSRPNVMKLEQSLEKSDLDKGN
ncbi:MAG: hypothetical protein ACXAB7_02520 [Candidatus Kariarchaeaceae archaeon]